MNTQPRSRHWQLAPIGFGTDIASDAADIDLCITQILATRQGEDVCRPDFGSKLFDYIDTPQDVFIPNAVREVVLAIQTWEKRAVVENITFAGSAPHLSLTVHWRIADEVAGEIYQTQLLLNKAV